MNQILLEVNASMMYRAGVNPVQVLLWSRTRTLREVLTAMKMIASKIDIDFSDENPVFPDDLSLQDLEFKGKTVQDDVEDEVEEGKLGDVFILKCTEHGCGFSACINRKISERMSVNIKLRHKPPGADRTLDLSFLTICEIFYVEIVCQPQLEQVSMHTLIFILFTFQHVWVRV